jgi:hypothetical protein
MLERLFAMSVIMGVKLAVALFLNVTLVLEQLEKPTIIVFVWMDFGMIIRKKIVMIVTSRVKNMSGMA